MHFFSQNFIFLIPAPYIDSARLIKIFDDFGQWPAWSTLGQQNAKNIPSFTLPSL
jgi:hypothetical protein